MRKRVDEVALDGPEQDDQREEVRGGVASEDVFVEVEHAVGGVHDRARADHHVVEDLRAHDGANAQRGVVHEESDEGGEHLWRGCPGGHEGGTCVITSHVIIFVSKV